MAAGVIELPPLSKNAKMGDVYPSVLALHHKAGSAEVREPWHCPGYLRSTLAAVKRAPPWSASDGAAADGTMEIAVMTGLHHGVPLWVARRAC
jgi:hypothetical protein